MAVIHQRKPHIMLFKFINYIIGNFSVLLYAALIFLYAYIGTEIIQVAGIGLKEGQISVCRKVKLLSRSADIAVQGHFLFKVFKFLFQPRY